MTDEQITAPNPAERLRVMIDLLGDGGHGCFKKTSLCAILAHIDAQAAEIARLRERLTQAIERLRDMLQGDDGQAWDEAQRFVDIIAQETQP
jgi:hypothetical protein